MKLNDLIEKKLLIKSNSTESEINGSLAIAEKFIKKAIANEEIELYDIALSLSYQSMFHSARALLFKNNLKERSHSAMISVLKELYSKNNKLFRLLEILDSYRITRHAILYSGSGCFKEDAVEAISDAKKILELADAIIAEKKKV